MVKKSIRIERASVEDASAILKIQKEAFRGQAKIYNNKKLPPIIQSLKSIEHEFNDKIFLKDKHIGFPKIHLRCNNLS